MLRRVAELFHPLGAELGEGPVWDGERGCLWCVDIVAPAIHRIDGDGSSRRWKVPRKIGWILPVGDGELVAGLSDGLYRFRPECGSLLPIQPVETGLPGNRINDGTLGPDGALWFGTMDDSETQATGRFYRYDGELKVCNVPPAVITNGPAIAPDGRALYTVDTLARRISVLSIGPHGELDEAKPFASIKPEDGFPDGVTCDAEGGVWVGLWGGWCARRYDAHGRVTGEVRFPVANITKIALGGPDGCTAYATTARKGLVAKDRASQPNAGDVFTFPIDIGAGKPRSV